MEIVTSNEDTGSAQVKIAIITRDKKLQVRKKLDEGTVKRYADAMKAGVMIGPH